LVRIVDVEQPDTEFAAAFAHRPDEGGAARIGFLVAAGLGGDGVVLDREGQIGAWNAAALLAQLREGVVRMQFVQDVAVDIEKIAPIGTLADTMKIPDFGE
jgi:hypothetical protein